ncbi:MAG: GNAT family N-acetyltransferase [Synergistaceae bacterium]|jgi:ribosomal-protein-alanine N-acetyltransferase|nr:GNAT family N-acetyltransferase [Synergistaceae bacterium]
MASKETKERPFPERTTARLRLGPLDLAQTEGLHRVWTDPRVVEYLVAEPFDEPARSAEMIEILRGLFAKGEGIRWAVSLLPDGDVIGTCGFHKWAREHRRAEIGYELDSRHWRQGFMGEALTAALEYGFHEMDLNRVEAFVTVGNRLSRGFLAKMGFTLEGTLRHYEWARGRFQDQWLFSLLREEWRPSLPA